MQLYASNQISKIVPGRQKTIWGGYIVENNYWYGHLLIDGKAVRLSLCLDLTNQSVQFPIEEVERMERGDLIFFTCGDFFVLVNSPKLREAIKKQSIIYRATNLANYEVGLSELFSASLIENFGLIDMQALTVETATGIHSIANVKAPRKFLATKLRGCLIGDKPKYLLSKVTMCDSANTFQRQYFVTQHSILDALGNSSVTTKQGIGQCINFHSQNVMAEVPIISNRNLIRANGALYLITRVTPEIMERITNYCIKYLAPKHKPRDYNLQWAIKKAFYCRSIEEYQHYRAQFIECNGLKDKYSENEIAFFKDCYQVQKYVTTGNEHFYGRSLG